MRRLVFLIPALLLFAGWSDQEILVHTAHSWVTYAGPTVVGYGTANGGTGTPRTPGIPAGRQSNDIMVCVTITEGTTMDHSYPAGWNEVAEVANSTNCESSWAWRRSDGTETGTINVTLTGNTTMSFSIIWLIRGCTTSGNPYESNNDTTNVGSSLTNKAFTLSGDNRLALGLGTIEDNANCPTSWSNGWSHYKDTSTSAGNDGAVFLYYKQFITGTTSGSSTGSMSPTSDYWQIFGASMIP